MQSLKLTTLLSLTDSLDLDDKTKLLEHLIEQLTPSELNRFQQAIKKEKEKRKIDVLNTYFNIPKGVIRDVQPSFDIHQSKSQFVAFHDGYDTYILYEDVIYATNGSNEEFAKYLKKQMSEKQCGRTVIDAIMNIEYLDHQINSTN